MTAKLHALVLDRFDRLIGLDLRHVRVDGCITKAPGGGDVVGRSPVDRGKQGRKRSVLTDAAGIPLHLLFLAASIVVIHQLLLVAFHDFRWPSRPSTWRLR